MNGVCEITIISKILPPEQNMIPQIINNLCSDRQSTHIIAIHIPTDDKSSLTSYLFKMVMIERRKDRIQDSNTPKVLMDIITT